MKKTLIITTLLLFFLGYSQSLKKEIKQIIKDKNATVGVSVLDFENKKSIDINGNIKLPMLSVFKFHVALAVLNQIDQEKLHLDQKILIKKEELLIHTWSPIRENYPEGNFDMPLAELIKYTVAKSDNNGCDILLRLIGGTETVQKFINSKGINDFKIIYNEEKMHEGYQFHYGNWTTTNEANNLLKKFYDGKILSKSSTDFLMKTMLETNTGANKIVALLPKGTWVAHKTGSSGKNDKGLTIAENDMGIITLSNGKIYALSVFVSDSMESEVTNTQIVAGISKLVFDYFSKK